MTWITGCQAGPTPAALHVPREEFFARAKAVAVLPLQAARGAHLDRQARGIEVEIENELEACGITVVPAEAFQALWDQEVAGSSGLYDPRTGELDQARFDDRMKRCLTALGGQQPFDAILVPTLETVSARFRDGYARWDGASERVNGPDEWDSDIETFEGRLPALSLRIRIRDRRGSLLYEQRGGLQLLTGMAAGVLVRRGAAEALADPERNRAAVQQALSTLRAGP